jgi:hypothetical protein
MTAGTVVIPEKLDQPGATVAVVPTFQNFGGTRTNSFKTVINLKFFDGGIPENLDVSKPYLKVEAGDSIIAPNGVYQGLKVGMPAEDLQKAKDGHGQVLFWGSAEYSDIFNPKNLHHIRVCMILKPQEDQAGRITVQPIPYRPECNQND